MSDYLPPGALTNILGRLPAKSLLRFTCVCRSWLSLICDFTSAHTTAKPPFLLLHFSLPPNNPVLFCLRSDAHAVYAHRMLIFLKPGQVISVELLRKERERRLMLRRSRICLLGVEEMKKLEEEDYERERCLLDRLLEKKQTFDNTPPFSSPKLPTMDQILTEIEEIPATFKLNFLFYWVGSTRVLIFPKPGQEHTQEHLEEEIERRLILHKYRIALLGEEEAKKLQKEDYDRDECLLDQIDEEESAEREEKERKHRPRPDFVELTSTQLWDYKKRLCESGVRTWMYTYGFDVGDIPGYVFVPVRPFVLDCRESLERIEGYAKFALDDYNKRNNTTYQIVKALKANVDVRTYYITFQVKDMAGSGSPTLNFQAKVETFQGQETVLFIAPEP
ncbi:uncharacterized protein LOC131326852 isoform X4 [Rhododendron vialii]|uniref:uncharacterized protein LOC131326852 isoform X4 n=1 Tax=Rhododendron vialii TaxID=182163 RepID=UPI00265D8947|nr:uncharacterized protein LOC131326852 isoform X4 [Rhododendron vialii]